MDKKPSTILLFLSQALGTVFFAVVLTAYVGGLRATSANIVLHSEPIFRLMLSIFGGLMLLTIAVAVAFSYASKNQTKETPHIRA